MSAARLAQRSLVWRGADMLRPNKYEPGLRKSGLQQPSLRTYSPQNDHAQPLGQPLKSTTVEILHARRRGGSDRARGIRRRFGNPVPIDPARRLTSTPCPPIAAVEFVGDDEDVYARSDAPPPRPALLWGRSRPRDSVAAMRGKPRSLPDPLANLSKTWLARPPHTWNDRDKKTQSFQFSLTVSRFRKWLWEPWLRGDDLRDTQGDFDHSLKIEEQVSESQPLQMQDQPSALSF